MNCRINDQRFLPFSFGNATPNVCALLFPFTQVRASDPTAYYSCDDHFAVVVKVVDYGQGGVGRGHSKDQSAGYEHHGNPSRVSAPKAEGIFSVMPWHSFFLIVWESFFYTCFCRLHGD